MKNRIPSTLYATKQMISLCPMLDHIEESEKEKIEKNIPMLRLGAVLEKLLEHPLQKVTNIRIWFPILTFAKFSFNR
ncbi:uncharacterized protein OCT59_022273 [Rhizophagus irregularis]|nr:hypothetical protein RirG_262130 [Rhizophagus irregularis DAOM 197198w]UZO28761.1 hypothetical protein OCT59_022273 [Rhizophagus irregularis]